MRPGLQIKIRVLTLERERGLPVFFDNTSYFMQCSGTVIREAFSCLTSMLDTACKQKKAHMIRPTLPANKAS